MYNILECLHIFIVNIYNEIQGGYKYLCSIDFPAGP